MYGQSASSDAPQSWLEMRQSDGFVRRELSRIHCQFVRLKLSWNRRNLPLNFAYFGALMFDKQNCTSGLVSHRATRRSQCIHTASS